MIPLAAGAAFRRRGPSLGRRVSARKSLGRSPPGPAPAASGRSGTAWSGAVRVDIEVFNLEIYVHIVRPSLLESGVNRVADSRIVDGVNVMTVARR